MQGAWTPTGERYKHKKALREAVAAGERARLEATSWFGNEYEGAIADAPDGTYSVVGPNPHSDRRWYATVEKQGDSIEVR